MLAPSPQRVGAPLRKILDQSLSKIIELKPNLLLLIPSIFPKSDGILKRISERLKIKLVFDKSDMKLLFTYRLPQSLY